MAGVERSLLWRGRRSGRQPTESKMTVHDTKAPKGHDLVGAGQKALTNVQREFDRLYDDFTRGLERLGVGAIAPRVNMSEVEGKIEITAELPGLEDKDVEVTVAGDVLTIKGEKHAETERKERSYWLAERSYGSILRRVPLPPGVDPDTVKASMKHGVLTVTMDRPSRAPARKIEVKPA
jgi:HSP20 family protein